MDCRICGSTDVDQMEAKDIPMVFSDGKESPKIASFFRCKHCLTIFKNITDEWENSVEENYKNNYEASPNKDNIKPGAHLTRIKEVVEKMDLIGNKEPVHILDYGMGNGDFSRYLVKEKKNILVDGYDPFPHDIGNQLRNSKNFTHFHDLNRIRNTGKLYDYIVLIQSFEHIIEPNAIIKKLAKALKANGKIFIQIPCPYLNPVDLVVYDHSTHFGIGRKQSEYPVIDGLGMKSVIDLSNQKEILITLSKEECRNQNIPTDYNIIDSLVYSNPLNALVQFIKECKKLEEQGKNVAIFGTTYSSLWAQRLFKENVELVTSQEIECNALCDQKTFIFPFPKIQATRIATKCGICNYLYI